MLATVMLLSVTVVIAANLNMSGADSFDAIGDNSPSIVRITSNVKVKHDGFHATYQGITGSVTKDAVEISSAMPVVRANDVSMKHFVYQVTVTELENTKNGSWKVELFKDGEQLGNTVTIKQSTDDAGIEGVVIVADIGTEITDGQYVFEVRVTDA